MTNERFFELLQQIDEDLLSRAEQAKYGPETGKRRKPWRKWSALAACFCLLVGITAAVAIPAFLKNPGDLTENPSHFGEIAFTKGVADWYTPGSFAVNSLALKTGKAEAKAAIASPQTLSAGGLQSLANTKNESLLPDWIYEAKMLNDRYIYLAADPEQARETGYDGYLVYDMQEEKIVNLTAKIFELFLANIDASDRNRRPSELISIISFGECGDKCIFDLTNFTSYKSERYMIDIVSGEYWQVPRRNILAISPDGRYLVNRYEKTTCLYNVQTAEAKEMAVDYRGYAAFVGNSGRILFSEAQTNLNNGWNALGMKWKMYDIASDTLFAGSGRIVRVTENGDALVVRAFDGGHIYRFSDLADVTDGYKLKTHERYEIETRLHDRIISLYAVPLFGGEEIMIADNIEAFTEWNGYYYMYCYGDTEIIVYSTFVNKAFRYDISDLGIVGDRYDMISIYVTQNGRQCGVVTYTDESRHHEEADDPPQSGSQDGSDEPDPSRPEDDSSAEGSPPPEEHSLAFSFCVAYTDEVLPGGLFPFGNLILSSAQLTSYTEEIAQHDLFVTDRIVGDVPSYEHLIETYDETWFETNSLIVLVVKGYEHQTPVVREVKKSGARLIVYVDDSIEGGEQLFHLFIEVDFNDIAACDNCIDIYQS